MLAKFTKCLSLKNDYIHLVNDASFVTFKEGKKLYIYFEWSNGVKDWINNFRFLALPIRPYKGMKSGVWFCHRGFQKVWKSIEPHLVEAIRDTSVEEIEIVGYSHGAAIAQLCYEYVKYHRQDVTVTGVGFGSPRVVWGIISKTAKARFEGFTVIRNSKDIVTHLPPVVFGYRHIGKVIKIGKDSKGLIDDHKVSSYKESLKEYEAS